MIRALGVGGTVAALRQNEMCSETSASRPLIQEPFLPLRSISPAEVIENKLAGLRAPYSKMDEISCPENVIN